MTKAGFKYAVLAGLVMFAMHANASTVRDDIDYQLFRDFAENKGKFAVGAENIDIYNTDKKKLGIMLQGIKMPDFSSVNSKIGTHTLIDPQYVVSVAHNRPSTDEEKANPHFHLYNQQFGGQTLNPDNHRYNYAVVDIKSHPDYQEGVNAVDYQTPRLAKLVTEVAPAIVTQENLLPNTDDTEEGRRLRLEHFKNTYSAFLRLGSGTQNVIGKTGYLYPLHADSKYHSGCNGDYECKSVSTAYRYLTGGNLMPIWEITPDGLLRVGGTVLENTPNFLHDNNVPMTSLTNKGDSGSPVFAFNKKTGQWELISVLSGAEWGQMNGEPLVYNTNVLMKTDFNKARMDEDKIVVQNATANKTYDWQPKAGDPKNSTLTDVGDVGLYNGADYKADKNGVKGLDEKLAHGKTLHFKGEKGTLNLKSNVNQGAGALYFDNDFTVKADNANFTWLGAGVSVAENKTVHWQVKNPENDRLSKIGKGTLEVNGTGENKGDISVGDGTVFLNQKDGYAFNQVGIVSGRGTVKLANDKQVNPNNIYFGYRGGRLDVNGNDLTFNYIQNVDDGATLVNHNKDKTATITVIGKANNLRDLHYTINDKKYRSRGELHHLPADGQDNLDWQFMADANLDAESYLATVRPKYQALNLLNAFNGFLGEKDPNRVNGKLNFIYNPKGDGTDFTYDPPQFMPATPELISKYTLLLSGGSNLNGDLIAQGGTLLLSGRPTPYAIDAINRKELFKDDDWIDRVFKVGNLIAENNSKLIVGRNVGGLTGNMTFKNNAVGEIGFINGKTTVCVRSDYHGEVECDTPTYDDSVLKVIPTTQVRGDLTLNDNARLTFGNAHWLGKSIADKTTTLTLDKNAKWTMTDNSTLGSLTMVDGSEVTLNSNFAKGVGNAFNLLTIAGNLTGKGQFNYLTHLTAFQGDKIKVNGNVAGEFLLNVKNQGTEPTKTKEHLTLFTALGTVSQAPRLANKGQVVDLGAYRYALKSDDNKVYYLWSEALEKELDKSEAEKQAEKEAKEKAEREKAEKEAREKAEREKAEREAKERAEKEAREKAEREAKEKAEREKAEKEKAEREQAEKEAREKAEREAKEKAEREAREKAEREKTTQAQFISKYTNLALSAQSAELKTVANLTTLGGRLLDIQPKHTGVWLHTQHSDNNRASEYYRAYNDKQDLVQVGVDDDFRLENGVLIFGTALSHAKGSQAFDEGAGNSRLTMGHFYGKYLFNKGAFVGADTGYGQVRQELRLGETVNYHQKFANVGVLLGKSWQFGRAFAEPSVGIRHYKAFDSKAYTLDGARVVLQDFTATAYQPSIRFGYDYPLFTSVLLRPYVSTTYSHWSGETKLSVNGHQFATPFAHQWQHKFGLETQKGRFSGQIYATYDQDKESGDGKSAGLHIGYSW